MNSNLLIISPTQTHPCNAGNRVRILNFVERLKSLFDLNIYFFYVDLDGTITVETQSYWGDHLIVFNSKKDTGSPKSRTFCDRILLRSGFLSNERWDYNYHIDDCFDEGILTKCKELYSKLKFDVVLVEYVFMSKSFSAFPQHVKKIIDTHDCFTNRYKIYPLVDGKRQYQWFSTYKRDEKKGLNRADIIIAIQQEEAKFFRKIANTEVVTIGHLFDEKTNQISCNFKSKSILFFASDNLINIDAYHYFTKEVWPLLINRLPSCRLVVAGRICNAIEKFDGIVYLGEVSDKIEAYQNVSISVNPMQYGSGLKIKTLESLIMGVPIVSTAHGAIGLENMISKCIFVADTAQSFSNWIVELLTDMDKYNKAQSELEKCIHEYNDQNDEKLISLFN